MESSLKSVTDSPNLVESKYEMSNFDHTIDSGLEEDLKAGKIGRHSAWNFNAYLYYKDGKFYSEVWVFHEQQETFEANTLQELMDLANEKYGYE